MPRNYVHTDFKDSSNRGWFWPITKSVNFVKNQIKKVTNLVTTSTKVLHDAYYLNPPKFINYQALAFVATAGTGLYMTFFCINNTDEDSEEQYQHLSKICLVLSVHAIENYFALSSRLLALFDKHSDQFPLEPRISHALVSGATNGVSLVTNTSQFLALRELSTWITRASIEGNTYALPSGISVFIFACLSNTVAYLKYFKDVKLPQRQGYQVVSTTDGLPQYPNYLQSLLMVLPYTCARVIMQNPIFMFQFLVAQSLLTESGLVQRYINVLSLLSSILPQAIREINEYFINVEADRITNAKPFKVIEFTPLSGGINENIKQRQYLKPGDVIALNDGENGVELKEGMLCFTAEFSGVIFSTQATQNASVNKKALTGEDKSISVVIYTRQQAHDIEELTAKETLTTKHAMVAPGMEYRLIADDKVQYFLQIKPLKKDPKANDKPIYRTPPHMAHEQSHTTQLILFAGLLSSYKFMHVLSKNSWNIYDPQVTIEALKGTLYVLFSKMQCVIPLGTDFINDALLSRFNRIEFNYCLSHRSLQRLLSLYAVSQGLVPSMRLAFVSDKTGTLTLPGVYYDGMVINQKNNGKKLISAGEASSLENTFDALTLLVAAYTNSPDEPEENAVYQYLLSKGVEITIKEIQGGDNFSKTIKLAAKERAFESYHLGLFVGTHLPLGGRLTLMTGQNVSKLIFFGIPGRAPVFDVDQLVSYTKSASDRERYLTRDWGVFSCDLPTNEMKDLLAIYSSDDAPADKQDKIYNYILDHKIKFNHHLTVLIHNKLKPRVREFVNNFKQESGYFMMATGDTVGACKKIAKIIDPDSEILTYDECASSSAARRSILFTGFIPETQGQALLDLLNCPPNKRPILYFCSMSMEEKGALSAFLSKNNFFVVANGDAVNDTIMVANSDFSIVHGPADSNKTAIKGDITAFDIMTLLKKNDENITGDALTLYQTLFLSKNSPFMQLGARIFFGQEATLPQMVVFKAMKCGPQMLLKGPDQFLKGPKQANTALYNLVFDAIVYTKILATGMSRTAPTFMEPLPDRRNILQASQMLSIVTSTLIAIGTWLIDFDEYTFAASMFIAVGMSLAMIGVMLGRFEHASDESQMIVEDEEIKSPNTRALIKKLN